MNIAINGFGRIGRAAFRIIAERDDMRVVAINDLTDAGTLAHLLKYDTAYGRYGEEVTHGEGNVVVDGMEYPVLSQRVPAELPWNDYDVDVVLECTGRFVADGAAHAHIDAGARRVVVSAPTKGTGNIPMCVLGVNDVADAPVVSNASCTTNSIAPVMDILTREFGVEKSLMTTIHSYTANQNLQDGPHKDLRRARAAAANIVPTTTGGAVATAKVVPILTDKFDGIAVRVPTITVSLSDITAVLGRDVTVEEVNQVFTDAIATDKYRGFLNVTNEPLVSSDFIGNPYSGTVDLSMTKVVGGNLLKVVVWYDNEWGYANRLVDTAVLLAHK